MSEEVKKPSIRQKIISWQGLVIGLIALLLLGVAAFVIFQPIKVLQRMYLAPGYVLTDQNGELLNNENMRGHFVMYNFTYSGCREPECQQLDVVMKELQDRLDEAETADTPVSLVTISFDPEHDTPDVLRAYAGELDADTGQWSFVTGDPTRLKYIIGSGFSVYYNQKEDGTWQFSPTMVLVDGWGIVRAIYNDRQRPINVDNMIEHLTGLQKEVAASDGVGKLGYEAAHLFLCYY
jgi:protein SCO1/2